MNRALRDTVAGSFRLTMGPAQQTVLVAIAEGFRGWIPGAEATARSLAAKGLAAPVSEAGHYGLTAAGRAAVELLREAGLYDERAESLAP